VAVGIEGTVADAVHDIVVIDVIHGVIVPAALGHISEVIVVHFFEGRIDGHGPVGHGEVVVAVVVGVDADPVALGVIYLQGIQLVALVGADIDGDGILVVRPGGRPGGDGTMLAAVEVDAVVIMGGLGGLHRGGIGGQDRFAVGGIEGEGE